MKLEILPLLWCEGESRLPTAKDGSLVMTVGRLKCACGFWRWVFAKPLPDVVNWRYVNNCLGVMWRLRVWRLMVGFTWRRSA